MRSSGSLRIRSRTRFGRHITMRNMLFAIEPGGWDHTTCDNCTAHIPAMTLCYVTAGSSYIGLCVSCYRTLVVAKTTLSRSALWHLRRLFGAHSAA